MYTITYVKNLTNSKGAKIGGHCDLKPFRLSAKISVACCGENLTGLLAHELEHYRQHLITLTLYPFLYKFSRRFKLWAEVNAYKRQLECSINKKEDAFKYAVYLSQSYNLDISSLEAYKRLTE